MTRITKMEEYFEIGDLVKFEREVCRVIAVEPNEYSTDEITHITQWVWLDEVEKPVDASELELLSPKGYELL